MQGGMGWHSALVYDAHQYSHPPDPLGPRVGWGGIDPAVVRAGACACARTCVRRGFIPPYATLLYDMHHRLIVAMCHFTHATPHPTLPHPMPPSSVEEGGSSAHGSPCLCW
jgi:hypothetical protein